MVRRWKKWISSKSIQFGSIFKIITTFVIILLLNFINQYFFIRIDLTKEKRFSLTDATKKDLKELDEIVYFKIYLDGDLPPDFKKLQTSTKEILDEFRIYAGENIQYEFVDPSEDPSQEVRNSVYRELTRKGLIYNNIRNTEGLKQTEQIIFPGAIVSCKGEEYVVQLIKTQLSTNRIEMVNNSIQQLEYELMSVVRKAIKSTPNLIYFVKGHQEIENKYLADIKQLLSQQYTVDDVTINGKLKALTPAKLIIIAGPDSSMSEKDKYMIDQFIMKGGKVLWLVESVFVSVDSLKKYNFTMALPKELNYSDLLFKYGVRVNMNILMDMNALPIPIVVGMLGDRPQQEFFPWFYAPLIVPNSKHPIVNNVEAIKTNFISSIDIIDNNKEIKKTVLLKTSPYTKILRIPARISFNIFREMPDKKQFNKGETSVAVLLEGKFESAYKNILPTSITKNDKFGYKSYSVENKMIVISDADIIKNEFNEKQGSYYPLGYDFYTNRVYGNKEFILNAVNFLLDDDGFIFSRGKIFKIRMLDKEKIKTEKLNWQIINIGVPIVIILFLGFIYAYIRKIKYTK